jgi:NTP pyrophosphatase (non-canonical NTP hydrolase)
MNIKHSEMVTRLTKPGQAILDQMTAEKANLMHAAVGVAGEGGELLDAVKKHVIYNKPLDRANVLEELGDIEYFLEQIRQALGIERQQCLDANIEKLSVRYRDFLYSDQQAHDRRDKQPA